MQGGMKQQRRLEGMMGRGCGPAFTHNPPRSPSSHSPVIKLVYG